MILQEPRVSKQVDVRGQTPPNGSTLTWSTYSEMMSAMTIRLQSRIVHPDGIQTRVICPGKFVQR